MISSETLTSANQFRYLSATQVRNRFGNISAMCLWRWLNSAELNFPRPIYVNRRRFFREDEILAWESSRRQKPRG